LSRSLLLFLGCWWASPVVSFALSYVTPVNSFLPRYVAFSAPATVLLMTYFAHGLFPGSKARVWAVAVILLSTANPAAIRSSWRTGGQEIAPAVRIVRSVDPENPPPVVFSSVLLESNYYDWRRGAAPDIYLYAPLTAYPLKNRLIPMPYRFDEDAKTYISGLIDNELGRLHRVIFVKKLMDDVPWMCARMQANGFTADVRHPNDYTVVIFSKP
jgi:hypothetical protein